jgi:hypothetical protein
MMVAKRSDEVRQSRLKGEESAPMRDPRAVFGYLSRTKVLVLLSMLESSHVREMQRLSGLDFSVTRRVVLNLEREGIVAAQALGRTRRITFNPRYHALETLRAYLRNLHIEWPELAEAVGAHRKRPRRSGKPL